MTAKPADDLMFAEIFERHGPAEVSRMLGVTPSAVFQRRVAVERRIGRQLTGPAHHKATRQGIAHPGRLYLELSDGVVVIGSDAHYWPGIVSPAHRALVKFCKEQHPAAVIMNGDMVDGASISRHPPIGWEDRPSVIQEIETCQERLGEITMAAGKARRFWPLGNHDARFETRLATVAPEYAKVKGVHLHDHFPDWEPCWSVQINADTIVKHRYKGGIHATHNNTMWSGWNIFTGHLHSAKVTPVTDYDGTRWGTDCGTLADPFGPQFEYQEDNPRNHRSAFAVATFHQGRLLQPELVLTVDDEHVQFRGKVIHV